MKKGKNGATPGGKGPAGEAQTKEATPRGVENEELLEADGNTGTRRLRGLISKTLDLSNDPKPGIES